MASDSPGLDDLRGAVRYTRPQPDLYDCGSGHGRAARVGDGGLRHGSCAKSRPRLAAKSWAQRRRGRQVCAADRLHGARALGSPVSAGPLQRRWQHFHTDQSIFLEYYSKSRRLIEDVHHLLLRFGIFSLIREKTTAIGTRACQVQITDEDQILRFAQRIGFSPGSVKQRVLEERVRRNTLPQEAWALPGAVRVARMTGDPYLTPLIDEPVWDEVEGIEPAGIEEVFDITVPTLHNFVANDFIVHNSTYARCGIIVNVTPLEPEWEGHVTLEFSNTTPLPAKIYANEGVAQMLFFESDEVCETSYRDRGGKYQGQRGVTLPKT